MQGRPRRWILLLSLGALLFAGCWDRREIEERSNVMASGIDVCEEDQDCRLVISRQIAIPGRIPQGSAEGVGGGGGEDTVVVFSAPGKTPPETLARAQTELNRMINFGQTRLQVFGEAYARRGLAEYLDYLRRMPEFRRLMWVIVTEGRADNVLRARPSLERVPALFLNDMIEDAVRAGRIPQITLGDFLVRLSNPGEEPVAPLIRMAGRDHPIITGLAVFRGADMVGKLDLPEGSTFLHLRGQARVREQLTLALPGGRHATVTVYGSASRYMLRSERGRIHALVRISMEAELTSLSPGLDSSDPSVLAMVERAGAREVARRSKALTDRLQQELHSDILGLGEMVRSRMPGVWASISSWPAAFDKAKFDFEVEFHVRRTGMAMD